ncbi:MAG: hypothetical protein JSR37_01775 [Verrucomicrobia bacterium]|nr:hypothetical protein [Verrucomicrobiota bacterium]MBS0635898.1 hypothetical protein [Verrucomicrobiota bacterium]
MKITDKIISIPPFISTTWDKVSSLHMDDKLLIVTLKDTTRVAIPGLSQEVINEIFHAHANSLGEPQTTSALAGPFRMLFGTLESLTQALQHNPAYSNLAPLPEEVVSKIQMLAKSLPPEELENYLHPIDGCNCMYCQITRILKGEESTHVALPEEEVAEDELKFEEWIVESVGDKMYKVTNKLDPTEHYNVYLGEPIGCTCGRQNCEHIVAVLRH